MDNMSEPRLDTTTEEGWVLVTVDHTPQLEPDITLDMMLIEEGWVIVTVERQPQIRFEMVEEEVQEELQDMDDMEEIELIIDDVIKPFQRTTFDQETQLGSCETADKETQQDLLETFDKGTQESLCETVDKETQGELKTTFERKTQTTFEWLSVYEIM